MSAHHTPASESQGSIWNFLNVVIAAVVGGFALFWGAAFLIGGFAESAGLRKPAEKAAPPAAAAPAAAAPADAEKPAATVAATPAPASDSVAEITIKPDTANPLAYDTKEFKVKAGQKVRLTFNNVHPAVPQPHNIVIGALGSKDKLFNLAMQMATAPDGMAKGFIPEAPEVLFHTNLLQPNQSQTLEFTAPAAGDYPYLCTFPGHGAIMNGVMKVE
jgi:azurin